MTKKTIYCILGGSGSGKTYLAKQLVPLLGANTISTDKFRALLQQTKTKDHPINIFLNDNSFIKYSQKELLSMHREISQTTCIYILDNIHKYLDKSNKLILEGDDLTIQLIQKLKNKYTVIAICLFENEEKVIKLNIRKRDASLKKMDKKVTEAQLRHAYLNGLRIKQEVEEANIPILAARPYDTLIERVLSLFS